MQEGFEAVELSDTREMLDLGIPGGDGGASGDGGGGDDGMVA